MVMEGLVESAGHGGGRGAETGGAVKLLLHDNILLLLKRSAFFSAPILKPNFHLKSIKNVLKSVIIAPFTYQILHV